MTVANTMHHKEDQGASENHCASKTLSTAEQCVYVQYVYIQCDIVSKMAYTQNRDKDVPVNESQSCLR